MTKVKESLYAILGFALVGFVIYIAVRIVVASVRTFEGLDKQVAAALVAGMASVLVATASLVGGRYFERRSQREQALRAKKTEIYEQFIGGMFEMFDLTREQDGSPEARATRSAALLAKLTPQLVAWASNDVVSTWSRTKRSSAAGNGIELLFSMEEVLKAIRRDLGHSSRGLKKGDLLGLFVTDVDDHLDN